MTWFRAGGAGIPASLKNNMNSVLNKKFGTTGQNYPPNGWPDDVNLLGPLPIVISSKAPIVSFNDGADDVPISEGIFYIAPSQSGTGTPSPSNPRPLVGYTGMTINQTGKNLLKLTDGTYSLGNTQATITISNGTLSVTGTTTNSGGRTTRLSDYFLLKKGTYYLSPVISSSPYVRSYLNKKSDNTVVGYSSGSSFTVTEDIEVYFGVNVESGYTYNATLTPQLEVGSTATTYEAYKAKTPIVDAFGRTIYGGERSTDGTLTETWGLLELRVSDMNNSENYPGWKNSGIKALYGADKGSIPTTDFLVNVGDGLGINTNGNNDICFLPTGTYGLTQSQWQAQYPDLVIQILVKLATPNEYSLSPISLNTYYGDNNVWCDTGDTQLNYRADIDKYINNHIH